MLDLEPTRWGMRVEGVVQGSPNQFEVGSTIAAIGGEALAQPDNSEASLDRVEAAFAERFRDGAAVQLVLQDERLVSWARLPKDVDRLSAEFDLIVEYCAKGLQVYGPAHGLELALRGA